MLMYLNLNLGTINALLIVHVCLSIRMLRSKFRSTCTSTLKYYMYYSVVRVIRILLNLVSTILRSTIMLMYLYKSCFALASYFFYLFITSKYLNLVRYDFWRIQDLLWGPVEPWRVDVRLTCLVYSWNVNVYKIIYLV